MKIYFIIGLAFGLTHTSWAQQAPTLNAPPNGGQNDPNNWSRSGNLGNGANNQNNLFGTKWNSPIYTITGNNFNSLSYRMKVNGNFIINNQYPINGFTNPGGVNTTGYILMGNNTTNGGQSLYQNKGAFSLLHLNGRDGAFVQEFGYRPWMKTGITLTDNQDLSYFGLRKVEPNGFDVTETTIAWSDNPGGPGVGPDDMVFRFTGGNLSNGAGVISSNLNSTTDLDGLHVVRYTGDGLMGLGNTFGINASNTPAGLYVRPSSLLHLSHDWTGNNQWGFMQVTYRNLTGETAADGLRVGVDQQFGSTNGYLRWQENTPFIVQTDWNNTPGGIAQGERMPVSSINAPGVPNPLGLNGNTTRVSISYDGNQPITQPRSLLHLGYNHGSTFFSIPFVNGWRPWMDLGMLVSNSTDNVYIGLKPRNGNPSASNNQMDAVVAWGNDANYAGSAGPDVMRFIYTAEPLSPIDSSNATSQDGLEIMRMYPGKDVYYSNGDSITGRVGVGDFTAQGVNQQPTHKLDVVGNGRFRYLPDSLYMADSTVNKIVMVDSLGVLRWGSFVPSTFGASCSDTVNGKLLFDTKVDLNNENLYFTKNDSIGRNRVGIGFNCGDSLIAKLNVFSDRERINSYFYTNDAFNLDPTSQQFGIYSFVDSIISNETVSVKGELIQYDFINRNKAVGVQGIVTTNNVKNAIGVEGLSNNGGYGAWFSSVGGSNGSSTNGAHIEATNSSSSNTGIYSYASGNANSGSNIGIYSAAFGSNVANNNFGSYNTAAGSNNSNFGAFGEASGGTFNAGIFGRAAMVPNSYAGYFQGNVYYTGSLGGPSDLNLKENIESLIDSDSLLNLLNPVSFDFKVNDYPGLNLPTGTQFGLIAQEVQVILPELVNETTSPAIFDSLGNEIVSSETFKTIDYTKLIPHLIKGHQKQDSTIAAQGSIIDSLSTLNYTVTNNNDSLEQVVSDLNARLTALENCLSNILPALCNANSMAVQSTPEETQEYLEKTINITLSNRNNIVLNQNVPNPFAESTVISFSIPSTVQKAQIHFYDGQGKLINTVDVIERGNGQLNVFANDLSTGVYTYSLVADGQIVATKRMMKQ